MSDIFELLEGAADAIEAAPKIDLRPDLLKAWDQAEPMFRQYREDPRPQIRFEDLGLKPNGGVHNIIKVYNAATPAERDFWGRWYVDASGVVQDMAAKYDLPIPVVAGVVAVLSPGNKWWLNVRIADKLILFWKHNALRMLGPLSAYPLNIQKAVSILERGDPSSLITSPKVGVFFDSLVDPVGVEDNLVLDGHAINIWAGRKASLKDAAVPNDKLRAKMEADYAEAARKLGISVQALQATTWYVWKFVDGIEDTNDNKMAASIAAAWTSHQKRSTVALTIAQRVILQKHTQALAAKVLTKTFVGAARDVVVAEDPTLVTKPQPSPGAEKTFVRDRTKFVKQEDASELINKLTDNREDVNHAMDWLAGYMKQLRPLLEKFTKRMIKFDPAGMNTSQLQQMMGLVRAVLRLAELLQDAGATATDVIEMTHSLEQQLKSKPSDDRRKAGLLNLFGK